MSHDDDAGYRRYVALGDSFTEGLDDPRGDGTYRGWADLVAQQLARRSPGLRYANLAVRSRRLAAVRDEQLGPALAMRPDLVTVAAGANDIMGFRCDVPAVAEGLVTMLAELVATGARVLVFTGYRPHARLPLTGLLARRILAYNTLLDAGARELGVEVVDLWGLQHLYRDPLWSPDRLHLSAAGHAVVAASVLEQLGLPAGADTVAPAHSDRHARALHGLTHDLRWAAEYFAPWLGRRLRGRSTGDALEPKRPELTVVSLP